MGIIYRCYLRNVNCFSRSGIKDQCHILPIMPSGAPLHTFSKLYYVPVGFVAPPSSFEAVYCFICGRRRVTVARYRKICLVLQCKFTCRAYFATFALLLLCLINLIYVLSRFDFIHMRWLCETFKQLIICQRRLAV